MNTWVLYANCINPDLCFRGRVLQVKALEMEQLSMSDYFTVVNGNFSQFMLELNSRLASQNVSGLRQVQQQLRGDVAVRAGVQMA